VGSAIITTTVIGQIDYTWKDAKGLLNKRRSPYSIEIPLLTFKVGLTAECGAGAPVDADDPATKLKLDEANYRLPLAIGAAISPGRNSQYGISLMAEKASQHTFQVVLQLADGSLVRTGPIDLLYFRERDQAN
jgi:hypothetical protein